MSEFKSANLLLLEEVWADHELLGSSLDRSHLHLLDAGCLGEGRVHVSLSLTLLGVRKRIT